MVDVPLPNHVVIQRRDGRREVLLHRSLALIGDDRVEIRNARATVLLPLLGLAIAGGAIAWMILTQGSAPIWLLVVILLVLLFVVPASVMGLVSAVAGADVIIDARKNSASWQQGYLGMGIGTRELVPFQKIDYLEVTVEGEDPDRWHEHPDDLRQFALTLVKKSGRRLALAQVPVPAYGQADGMDRTLAVGQAIAALTGVSVRIPETWELVEIDTDSGQPVPAASPAGALAPGTPRRRPRTRGRQRGRT